MHAQHHGIEATRSRIDAVAPVSHRLHDYFLESLGIIERIIQRAAGDSDSSGPAADRETSAGKQPPAGTTTRENAEVEFLLSFLNEELDVAKGRGSAAEQTVLVTDHGLVGDGETDNGPALRALLSTVTNVAGFATIVFPPGVYYIEGLLGRPTIELDGLSHLAFQGYGEVTLLCDGRVPPNSSTGKDNLSITHCYDLELRNLTIDNTPLPFTVGTITRIISGNEIEIAINPGYPEPDESYHAAKFCRGLVKDPTTGRIRRDCGDPRVPSFAKISPGVYRLTLDDNTLSGRTDLTGNFEVGAYFSFHPRQRPGAGNGLSITSCRHLLFSHFALHSADSHAYGIATSAGVKFLDCAVEPAPGRVAMTNADAFHCRSNAKGIYLERCRVLFMNDDCMNFYSKLASIGDAASNRRFILLQSNEKNEGMSNFHPGDAVAFVNPNTGETDGSATIESVEEVTWAGQKGLICLVTDRPVAGTLGRRQVGRPEVWSEREYVPSGADNYRAAMAIDALFEHMVLNLNAKNDGFIIRNCEMGHNRATGFKCKATNGVMRNTRFHDQVLLFQSEPDWQEGTFPGFIECSDIIADKGIHYQATLPGKRLTGSEAARHIRGVRFERVRDAIGRDIPTPDEAAAE